MGILPARTLERVAQLPLLQGIFPSQGLNPDLLHCRQILYHLSYQGSPRILEWIAPTMWVVIAFTERKDSDCKRRQYAWLSKKGLWDFKA